MSARSIGTFIFAVCLYIYIGIVVSFLFKNFPTIIIHIGALIGLVLLYAYLAVRGSRSYDFEMLNKLQSQHSYLCIGVASDISYAVGTDPSGITVYQLAKDGHSIKSTLHMPYADVEIVPSSTIQGLPRADRGATVGIKRLSDGQTLIMGMMEIDQAKNLSMASYIGQRVTKSRSDDDNFIDKLMQPASQATASQPETTDKNANSLEDIAANPRAIFLKVFVASFLGIILSIVLAMATVVAVDADIRREVLSPVTTCEGPSAKITTLPVNKSIEVDGATITVKNVTYNVPQEADQPQPYSYQCQKATLVQVEMTGQKITTDTGDDEMGLFDFDLKNQDDTSTGPEHSEQYEYYAKREGLKLLEHSSFNDTKTVSGWLAFPVVETSSDTDSVFSYSPPGSDIEESVALPAPKSTE